MTPTEFQFSFRPPKKGERKTVWIFYVTEAFRAAWVKYLEDMNPKPFVNDYSFDFEKDAKK